MPDGSGERHRRARLPVPPPLYFALGLGAGGFAGRLRPAPFPASLPFAARIALGFGLVALSAALVVAAIRRFRRAGTTILPYRRAQAFVAEGPYRFTRNPMYVGLAGASLGFAILLDNLWMVAGTGLAVAAVDLLVIRGEEERLEASFGDDYRAFKRRVRRWL